MLLYFGILYSNNCGNLRCLHHSALLLIFLLHLPCPRISYTLNSKLLSLNNPFLLSLWHKLLSALWPLDLANGFHFTVIFHSVVYFHFVHLRQCLWISHWWQDNTRKPLAVNVDCRYARCFDGCTRARFQPVERCNGYYVQLAFNCRRCPNCYSSK